jgi:Zn-dependent protease
MDPAFIPIWFVIFLLSLSIHEAAHAWTAQKMGDPTARYLGRVTLNPLAHIDLLGTIIFPLLSVISGSFFFGWAKPVPVNLSQMRDQKWGDILVSIAGPASNVLLALIFFTLLKVSLDMPQLLEPLGSFAIPAIKTLETGLTLNIVLAVFNMLPIPPLDGSHVLRNLLPENAANAYDSLHPMIGMVALVVLIQTGITSQIMAPIFGVVVTALQW